MPRKLRIAVSVFFGVLTLLLVVLWVRSYWRCDALSKIDSNYDSCIVGFDTGRLHIVRTPFPDGQQHGWSYVGDPAMDFGLDNWNLDWRNLMIVIPCWALVGVSIAGVLGPWITYRFSLRTLLIATTLLAVVLGLAVWTGR